MWDFIWHLRGSTRLGRSASDEAVLAGLKQLLERERKPFKSTSNGVEFYSPLWKDMMGPNWLAMVIYDRGRFWIEQSPSGRRLGYELRSLHGFIFCLFGALMFFGIGASSDGVAAGLKFAAFAFGWLYGMNMLLAWTRIPRAIRRAVGGGRARP